MLAPASARYDTARVGRDRSGVLEPLQDQMLWPFPTQAPKLTCHDTDANPIDPPLICTHARLLIALAHAQRTIACPGSYFPRHLTIS
jgi:hypothetical protein